MSGVDKGPGFTKSLREQTIGADTLFHHPVKHFQCSSFAESPVVPRWPIGIGVPFDEEMLDLWVGFKDSNHGHEYR